MYVTYTSTRCWTISTSTLLFQIYTSKSKLSNHEVKCRYIWSMHLDNLKKFSLSPDPSLKILKNFILLSSYTHHVLHNHIKHPRIIIFTKLSTGVDISWKKWRKRSTPSTSNHVLYCQEILYCRKKAARPSKCRLKKIGTVIHSHQSRMRIARIKKTDTNDLNYNLH